MADVVAPVWPGVIQWLDKYGRMAVQVFLVLGGYLAAAALAPQGVSRTQAVWPALAKRYARLCLPFSAALVCAILVNETVRSLGFDHPSVSDTPVWSSVLAHLLLVHSIGEWESLSAGVWYVAIDFQLYALVLLWLWLCSRQQVLPWLGQCGVALAAMVSLWHWNLDTQLDVWAPYFLGAYGMGMLAWWATYSASRLERGMWLLWIVVIGVVALDIAWRDRVAVALVTALVLAIGGQWRWPAQLQTWQCMPLVWVGQRSYSIFLIHFPMSLLVSAEVHSRWPERVVANGVGMLASVLLSIAAGSVLYEYTERGKVAWQHLRNWHIGALSMGGIALAMAYF